MKTIEGEIRDGIQKIGSEIDIDVVKEIWYEIRYELWKETMNDVLIGVWVEVEYEIESEIWNNIEVV